ncbi:aldo/keto reductase [Liquorilactobacillus satsumensis]|uniref:aldo/keto reductase n=1 Tax=Liquorilactobacillus TaxID=2767888 RepID=UPI001E35849D|nr:aldo/keto reductase [Liquorilactobacillus satsumensis]MCC7666247.1 aldo/keto reductase [Liquorilactobacillus satsumensis]MCP9313685.1 aldo/keto reductase [Liquorilactobacillus satsumensis]MCP9327907.1 aldo/keto reductase [Liquorilactobacillus satsumensis]MCP9358077.1 aldo/keto reductase [Liquorilactobacillus satsumensis]MCP9360829.1 aldo/keto reductase [Liquorilactobacillus satsumensis]
MNNLRQLGQTNLYLSPLGLGTWQYSTKDSKRSSMWGNAETETVYEIIKYSLQHGMNWIDTAEIYGNGTSERFIGEATQRLQAENLLSAKPLIASKWFPLARSAASIAKTIDDRLKYLKVPTIDLYQIHQPTSRSSLRKQIEALVSLADQHKINQIGVSNFSAKQMVKAHRLLQEYGMTLASNQVKYNLLHRNPETNGTLEAAKELGITLIAYSPLQQGLLTGRFHEHPETLAHISRFRKLQSNLTTKTLQRTAPLYQALKMMAVSYDVTISQISLNWLINSQGDTVLAIPGASKIQQAQENVATLDFELSISDIAKLNKISAAL